MEREEANTIYKDYQIENIKFILLCIEIVERWLYESITQEWSYHIGEIATIAFIRKIQVLLIGIKTLLQRELYESANVLLRSIVELFVQVIYLLEDKESQVINKKGKYIIWGNMREMDSILKRLAEYVEKIVGEYGGTLDMQSKLDIQNIVSEQDTEFKQFLKGKSKQKNWYVNASKGKINNLYDLVQHLNLTDREKHFIYNVCYKELSGEIHGTIAPKEILTNEFGQIQVCDYNFISLHIPINCVMMFIIEHLSLSLTNCFGEFYKIKCFELADTEREGLKNINSSINRKFSKLDKALRQFPRYRDFSVLELKFE